MKTFRDIYKFPLVELGYSIGRVYDSDNNFVFQFHIESKSTREKLLKCINGEINLTNPHINFRHEDGYILDKKLSKEYNVSESCITHILNNTSWKEISIK